MAKRETTSSDMDDFAALETELRIDKNSLDDALVEQPDFYYRVSKAYSLLLSRRDAAKSRLEEVRAEADGQIRNAANKTAEKVTETSITNRVLLSDDVREAIERLAAAQSEMSKWLMLREAFEQRSYALKDLSALYSAGYFTDRTGSSARRDAGDRKYEKDKEGLAQSRRETRQRG